MPHPEAEAPPPPPIARRWRDAAREFIAVLANARHAFGLLVDTDARLASGLAALAFADAVLPVAVAWVGKRVIDAVVAAGSASGADPATALRWVLLEGGLVLARGSVTQLNALGQTLLSSSLGLEVNARILEKAINVSYRHFEDPAFNDHLAQARREASTRPLDVVRQILALGRNLTALAGYAVVLGGFSVLAVVALLVSAVPPLIAEARFGREAFLLKRRRTPDTRQAHYLEVLLSQEATVKEVKLFSLSRLLLDRYRALYERFHAEDASLAVRRGRATLALGTLSLLALYACYAWVVTRAVAGEISVGAMALYLVAFREGQAAFQAAMSAVARIYEGNLFMANLFDYLGLPEDEPHQPIPLALPGAG